MRLEPRARSSKIRRIPVVSASTTDKNKSLLDEVAQARIRNYLHVVLVILTLIAYQHDSTISFFGVVIVSALSVFSAFVLYVWASAISAGRTEPLFRLGQRACGIASDNCFITAVLVLGGESTAGIWALYIWISIGYGVRYGVRYLYANIAISMLAFLAVYFLVPFWNDRTAFFLGLILSMLVVPMYVGWLIRQLHNAVEERERAYAAKSEFTARMSHELRTPLHAIISTADLLRERVQNLEQGELVNLIAVSSNTLLDLVNRVLDLSRFESGVTSSTLSEINIYRVIGDSFKISIPEIQRKMLSGTLAIDIRIPHTVIGASDELKEIFVNLIGNAVKFTNRGNVSFSAQLLGETSTEAIVVFRVVDTGIGIASSKLDAIFEPYTQADTSTTRSHGGTGLGISFTRELVRNMGGKIDVDSKIGDGSAFRVELPFQKLVAQQPFRPFDEIHLIILSHHTFGHSYLLSNHHRSNVVIHECTSLLSALQALNELEQQELRPGVIVNVEENFEQLSSVIGKLKESSCAVHLPIVGYGSEAYRANSFAAGCVAFFTAAEKRETLDNLLSLFLTLATGAPSDHPDAERQLSLNESLDILVADDDATNRKILTMLLEREGHNVTVVEDGEAALHQLSSRGFDAAILDMHMPRRDGVEVVKIFRFSSYDADLATSILLFTADSTQAAREHAIQAGVDRFVTKPIRPDAFLATLYSVVRTKRGLPPPEADLNTLETEMTNGSTPIVKLSNRQHGQVEDYVDDMIVADLLTYMSREEQVQFFSEFCDDARLYAKSYLSAVDLESMSKAQENMHALAGAAVTIGAMKLAEIARGIEKVSAIDAMEQKSTYSPLIESALDATVIEVESKFLNQI